jgi:glutamate/tyrosine decarboxylase-like PLP-dependent enzyme
MNPRPCQENLDPEDWPALRAQGHVLLDELLDFLESVGERPVWRQAPGSVQAAFQEPLPRAGRPLIDTGRRFLDEVLPYGAGNLHPGFMGWVHGGGTPVGMLAEMLAAGLNANVGGRNQMPVRVERQVVAWMRELFGFPEGASGILVTGTSMANLMSLLVARSAALGPAARRDGLAGAGLVGYASAAAHRCVEQAFEIAGLGSSALRRIPVDGDFRMRPEALAAAVAADRAQGLRPFYLVATAGSVDTGSIDPLPALAELAARERLWFHIDGAYGALAMLAPELRPLLAGIERADSLAFDFHKWGQVPYDAGFLLVRDSALHLEAFAAPAAYLRREARGLAGDSPWPCDLGPDLSRGFRALKVWFTFQVFGADRLGAVIARTCRLARLLAEWIDRRPELERLAPVALNVVVFRYRAGDSDRVNAAIVADLHASGLAAPSTTTIGGHLAIRAAIVNHRTAERDLEILLTAVLRLGGALAGTP